MSVISDDELPFDQLNEPDDLAEGAMEELWDAHRQRRGRTVGSLLQ
jgi:hypothetical protein